MFTLFKIIMDRRNFVHNSGMLAALGLAIPSDLIGNANSINKDLKPVLLPAQSQLKANGGMEVRVWVRSAMTNGIYSSVECAVAPKLMGPPPHFHLELDELMYVAEGTASILMGKDVVEVEAGGWHLRPRNIVHTFFNASDKPLRFYDMYFNQPFEEYLEQVFFELTESKGYKDGSEKKNKAMGELNAKFGVKFPDGAFGLKDEIVKKYGLKS
jgi:mannose-6-phosphate isomerase-like protein (cupin superfamily)